MQVSLFAKKKVLIHKWFLLKLFAKKYWFTKNDVPSQKILHLCMISRGSSLDFLILSPTCVHICILIFCLFFHFWGTFYTFEGLFKLLGDFLHSAVSQIYQQIYEGHLSKKEWPLSHRIMLCDHHYQLGSCKKISKKLSFCLFSIFLC